MAPYSGDSMKIALAMYAAYTSISIKEHSCIHYWDIHIHSAQSPPAGANASSWSVQYGEEVKMVILDEKCNIVSRAGQCNLGLTAKRSFALVSPRCNEYYGHSWNHYTAEISQ